MAVIFIQSMLKFGEIMDRKDGEGILVSPQAAINRLQLYQNIGIYHFSFRKGTVIALRIYEKNVSMLYRILNAINDMRTSSGMNIYDLYEIVCMRRLRSCFLTDYMVVTIHEKNSATIPDIRI